MFIILLTNLINTMPCTNWNDSLRITQGGRLVAYLRPRAILPQSHGAERSPCSSRMFSEIYLLELIPASPMNALLSRWSSPHPLPSRHHRTSATWMTHFALMFSEGPPFWNLLGSPRDAPNSSKPSLCPLHRCLRSPERRAPSSGPPVTSVVPRAASHNHSHNRHVLSVLFNAFFCALHYQKRVLESRSLSWSLVRVCQQNPQTMCISLYIFIFICAPCMGDF